MAQTPLNFNAKSPANVLVPLLVDIAGHLITSDSGTSSSLNVTAAGVIKAAPGKLVRIVVISGGTTANGAFTFNDCLTTGAAAAANEIFTIPSGAAVGTMYQLSWPCLVGIVLSAVPSAGSPVIAISWS